MLPMWTITDSPSDFFGLYVARKHIVDRGGVHVTDEVWTSPSLNTLRRVMEGIEHMSGFFPRSPQDDPVIVETWM
jgi:hypothetical protein